MARRHSTLLPSRIEAEIQEHAVRNMRLAFRRAIKRNAMPKWAEHPKHKEAFLRIYRKAAIRNRFRSAGDKSGDKSGEFYHVDHIVPLVGENVCGLMVPWNLHVIPAVVNVAKGTIVIDEWLSKTPKDGRQHLREAQEKNKQRRVDQVEESRLRAHALSNRRWDVLFE